MPVRASPASPRRRPVGAEIAAGIGSFIVSQALVMRVARAMTREELSEDPGRPVRRDSLHQRTQELDQSRSGIHGRRAVEHHEMAVIRRRDQ
jgi:hypothetical protein